MRAETLCDTGVKCNAEWRFLGLQDHPGIAGGGICRTHSTAGEMAEVPNPNGGSLAERRCGIYSPAR